MKNLYMIWLSVLRFVKMILVKFDGDNRFIEWLVNKSRGKLKEQISDGEMKFIDKIINFMSSLGVIPNEDINTINKKYYSMVNSASSERIDELCDYIIIIYNANF